MAKLIKCPFCGKLMKTGFLSTDHENLQIAEYDYIKCCHECFEAYKGIASDEKLRFDYKLRNYKLRNGKKIDEEKLNELYLKYLAEKAEYESRGITDNSTFIIGCFGVDGQGNFCAVERSLDFLDQDGSIESMTATAKTHGLCDSVMFNKNDISKIEFRRPQSPYPLGTIKSEYAASYDILLNDESDITYKPCVARMTLVIESNLFKAGKDMDSKAEEILEQFKIAIGSDLPVVKAEKSKFGIFKK